MRADTYLLRALVYSLIVGCLVVAVNYVVDPYAITGVPRIHGVNEYKVEINEHTRVMKRYQPLFSTHNTLIIGNSRVELGILPSHACFRRNEMEVYNLGMPGADVSTQIAYALNLIYQQPIETIFLSIDFTDFISTSKQPSASHTSTAEPSNEVFRFGAAGEDNPDYHWSVFQDYFKSLFSLDALVASAKTLALQSRVAADRDEAGFNPARDFEEAVKIEGPRALFDQKMASLQAKYSRPWYLRDSSGQLNSAVGDVDAFLDITAARGIKVYLFTNPFHESFWELLRTQGHMQAYRDWMQSMEKLVRKHKSTAVVFWDFSGDSPYIHELVPAAGVRSGPLQWFWEPAHYRQQLGDIMIDAMLAETCNTKVIFGRQLF